MRINTNLNAMIATNQMTKNTALAGNSMEKLSTGLRITKAGDDAAGLAVSEKMRAQIRGMEQAERNVQDGISMVQTAEGALEEAGNIAQRMRELGVQAGNDTNTTSDREEIQKEIDQLTEEIDRIANNTEFNTQKLLNGNKSGEAGEVVSEKVEAVQGKFTITVGKALNAQDKITIDGKEITLTAATKVTVQNEIKAALNNKYDVTYDDTNHTIKLVQVNGEDKKRMEATFGGKALKVKTDEAGSSEIDEVLSEGKVNLQVGANAKQNMSVEIGDMRADALGIKKDGKGLSIETADDANVAVSKFDEALNKVSSQRANLGAAQNRLEYTISNLDNTAENLTSAESTLRDVDMAKEMMEYSKNNILNQAAQAMISQANQQPQNVLQLLR